jgi:hypothetical protein
MTRRPRYQAPGASGGAGGRSTRSARRCITSDPSRVRACEIADLLACTAPARPSPSRCKPSQTTRSTSSSGASRHSDSAITQYTTAGAGNSRLRRLPRSVCCSTSSINGLGRTLASTPVLIKCATSSFCGNALRVLAIDSACNEGGGES